MKQYLQKLMDGKSLNLEEMKEVSGKLFTGEATESEAGALLGLLTLKGETVDEIVGLVQVIREKSPVSMRLNENVLDNCGTGGDASSSFNISTTSAFVVAGAGIKVAKHGNRSVSSQTGSADVFEYLGVSLESSSKEIKQQLTENNLSFIFAPHAHPTMKAVMGVRTDLRLPTIFNLIGPLTNPVELETQMLGIYRRDKLMLMGEVLKKLGRQRAVIINGAGFLDEGSLSGDNHLVILEDDELTEETVKPEDVGLPRYSAEEIIGGHAERNAQIMLSVLHGDKGPYRDTVLFNAGLAIFASGGVKTIQVGVELAKQSIDSGAAMSKLDYLIGKSKHVKQGVM